MGCMIKQYVCWKFIFLPFFFWIECGSINRFVAWFHAQYTQLSTRGLKFNYWICGRALLMIIFFQPTTTKSEENFLKLNLITERFLLIGINGTLQFVLLDPDVKKNISGSNCLCVFWFERTIWIQTDKWKDQKKILTLKRVDV